MDWPRCQIVLVPVTDINTDTSLPTLAWAVTETHEAHLTPHGMVYTPGDGDDNPPLFIVTGVPFKVEYTTKVADLVSDDNIQRVVTEFVAMCQLLKPKAIYLPEAGLASVPMKNQTRIQWGLQAKINAQVSTRFQELYMEGEITSLTRYLALSEGTLRVPLIDVSELQN